MVLVKEIEFYSMCEHHMLPFFGKAHVAYLPKGKIIGVSKIARLIDRVLTSGGSHRLWRLAGGAARAPHQACGAHLHRLPGWRP